MPNKPTQRVDIAFPGDDLDAQLAAAADDAENNPDAPITDRVKVTRGHSRTKVLQIRLNDTELAELERVAAARGLPPSTVAREAILRHLFPDEARQVEGRRLATEIRRFIADYLDDDDPKPAEPQPAVVRKAKMKRGGVIRVR